MFWTVLKADLVFGLCSVTFTALATVAFAYWKKRNQKKALALANAEHINAPKAYIIGGKEPNPGHCPLCGQGWPLQGPDANRPPSPEATPNAAQK